MYLTHDAIMPFVKNGQFLTAKCGTKVGLVDTTEEFLQLFIASDTNNRPQKATNLNYLRKAFSSIGHKFNGQSLCASVDGIVLNGGHRGRLLMEKGLVEEILLAWNMPADRWATFDLKTSARTLTDYIKKENLQGRSKHTASKQSSCVTYMLAMEQNNVSKQRNGVGGLMLTTEELIREYERLFPEIEAGLTFMIKFIGTQSKPSTLNFGPKCLWVALFNMMARVDAKAAKEFFIAMRTQAFDASHPAVKLMNKINAVDVNRRSTKKEAYVELVDWTWGAFNYYRTLYS